MAESTRAIVTAAAANLAIAVAKFAGAGLTGSSAMFSEGAHSIVDTTNQGLLLVGMHRADRPADARHPFGYGRELYFYSFVVALLIFLAGGVYSLYEGVEKIIHPEPIGMVSLFGIKISGVWINLAILAFAVVTEGYSLFVAFTSMPKGGGSPFSAIRRSKDPSLFVVVAEDTAAVVGLAVALAGVGLSTLLDLPVLDGAASIGIGLVLVGMAFFLMVETHGLLIGEAAAPEVRAAIEEAARAEPAIRHVNEILTQHLGPSDILVNLSLDIDDAATGAEVEALVGRLDAALKRREPRIGRVFVEMQSATKKPAKKGAAEHDGAVGKQGGRVASGARPS